MKYEKHIPIFFTVDDNYVPYLKVGITSLVEHASKKNKYELIVVYDKLSSESKNIIRAFAKGNISVRFYSISLKMRSLAISLDVRDYYTLTTYYRLLLPDCFPTIKKAIYLDSDIVLLNDIANFYDIDIKDNLLGVIPDLSIQTFNEFSTYVEAIVGVPHEKYFNAGVLLMNFKEMRRFKFESKAIKLLRKITFKVAQDQDVMNYICKDKLTYIPFSWNLMPLGEERKREDINLIHYNLILKPWKQDNIMYEDIFWEYAQKAGEAEKLKAIKDSVPQEIKDEDRKGIDKVKQLCLYEASRKDTYYKDITKIKAKRTTISQSYEELKNDGIKPYRKGVLEKVAKLEKEGRFDEDVENDPPYFPIQPGEVDYLNKKYLSKLKSFYANIYSFKYFNHLIKKGKIVIDGYEGIENLKDVKGGAIITANHFSPFDSIPVHKIVKKYGNGRKLFKIIREGNYTFPGLYGFFMRHCDTLPLATNLDVLKEFLNAVKVILKRGDLILIYPEQSMWWNYRKPKPLKIGAFKFAASNNVPVIPTFITLRDTDKLDEDGLPIQAYKFHILPAIYPNLTKNVLDQAEEMRTKNEEVWKDVYENVYQKPLKYSNKD
jgi:lipopolysaccharide biosynthesis glycosyltransferase